MRPFLIRTSIPVVLLLTSIASTADAQGWSRDPAVNIPISTPQNNQQRPQLVADGAGGATIVWHDTRDGGLDVYAQRIDRHGVQRWTANGAAIGVAAWTQDQPRLISDGSGGTIIVWNDSRNSHYDVYAQRVSGDGVAQWTANGIVVSGAANTQNNPRLVGDGAGGAIVVWQDYRTGGNWDIYAQRISNLGVAQWTANGVAIVTLGTGQDAPEIVGDGSGGAIIVWRDLRNGNYDLYAQRIDANGVAQWTANGVSLCTAAGTQDFCQAIGDGVGGAFVVWPDFRGGASSNLYAQRIDGNGVAQWTTNGVAIAIAGPASNPRLIGDGVGGTIVAWQDSRPGAVGDIYAQRINGQGVTQWTANGIVVSPAGGVEARPDIVADNSGGAIVVWSDSRNVNYDIYAQRIDAGGVTRWGVGDVAISTAANSQSFPRVATDGSGGAIVTWEDYRSGTHWDIYAQRVLADGSFDATSPTVVVTSTAANPTATSPIPMTATFSEIVTDFAVGDIAVGNGVAGNFSAVSESVYTFVVTPTADGVVTVDIAAGVARDCFGNVNTAAAQYSITYDATPPAAGNVNDGAGSDVDSQVSTTTIAANWNGFTDGGSGIASYAWAIGTTPGGTNLLNFTGVGTSTTASISSLTLGAGVTYYVTIRATNGVGLSSAATSDGVAVAIPVPPPVDPPPLPPPTDTTPPTAGSVNDGTGNDIDRQFSTTTIAANWNGFTDGGSGIASYAWAIGTTPGGTDVRTFTGAGTSTTASASSLTLTSGVAYYVTVRATDGVGLSVTTTSDGVTVVTPAATPTASPATGVAPLPIAFDATLQWLTAVRHEWDFDGDGAYDHVSTTSAAIIHTYSRSGIYAARYRAIDAGGVTATGTVTITVTDPPASSPTFTSGPAADNATPQIGVAVLFTADGAVGTGAGSPALQYTWDFDGNGRPDSVNVLPDAAPDARRFVYTASGVYTVTCTITDVDGAGNPRLSASATIVVTVPAPAPENIRVWIVQPRNGTTFSGDRLTVNINAVPAGLIDFAAMKLQYRAPGGSWTDAVTGDLRSAGEAARMVWNTANIPAGVYQLRAVAVGIDGGTHASDEPVQQGVVTVTKVASGGDESEATTSDGRERIAIVGNIEAAASHIIDQGNIFSVYLPADALRDADGNGMGILTIRTLAANPTERTERMMTLFCEIAVTDNTGTGAVELKRPIEIEIGYRDDDNDGVVDGVGIVVSTLKLMHYNATLAQWEILPDQTHDRAAKAVKATTGSLSPFALSGEAPSSTEPTASGGSGGGGGGCYIAMTSENADRGTGIWTIAFILFGLLALLTWLLDRERQQR